VLAARATEADAVLFFTGNRLGHGRAQECEGGDRPDLSLPEGDDAAIAAVLAARPDTVVINQSGSPVAMPWIDQAATLVQYWFSGMEGGTALARVLLGEVNPSGRLPFTFPRRLEDSPAHALGEYGPVRVEYREGVFIGYRWHDARDLEPLFPFGHGLSYTTFQIGAPELDAAEFTAGEDVRLRVSVTNTGPRAGAEVVQLYVGNPEGPVPRPVRELRAFAKVHLAPGETRVIDFTLPARAFAFWDTSAHGWRVAPGPYQLQSGASSRRLSPPTPLQLI
jgi:beta-glucosidase